MTNQIAVGLNIYICSAYFMRPNSLNIVQLFNNSKNMNMFRERKSFLDKRLRKPIIYTLQSVVSIHDSLFTVHSSHLSCMLLHVYSLVYLSIPNSFWCCGNHQTQSPIAAQGSKSLKLDIKWEVHKRTQQGVSSILESYLYKTCLVRATNNQSCSYVHVASSCSPHFLLKAFMLFSCALISSSRPFHYVLGL